MLKLGSIELGTPVILAPMAGVTDLPFRRICREFGEAPLGEVGPLSSAPKVDAPSGLYVMEMVTARALLEGNPQTWEMVKPDPEEKVRSVQLYGVDPDVMGQAASCLVERGYADHIDMNFGCPVPKVTRKGGGAALPWKRDLFEAIVSSVVKAVDSAAPHGPGSIPVTVKMRVGIDDDHVTALDAGKLAEKAGAAGVGLHARTQEQHYSGLANWEWITRLKDELNIPVFGNGDIFSGLDAKSMMKQTGCDAVIVGRGCQGRPWIFEELTAVFHGLDLPAAPTLRDVTVTILKHAALMVETVGDELRAMREMRKHIGWYLRGFAVGGELRRRLSLVSSQESLAEIMGELDLNQPFPPAAYGVRGRAGSPRKPHLPDGWLDSRIVNDQERLLLNLEDDGGSGG